MGNDKKAIYAFSGDPITYGHIDIIKRASKVFDKLTVAIGTNPDKNYLFSLKERKDLAENSLKKYKNVNVVSFSGTLVDYAYENSIPVVIKGIRDDQDFNYELVLHQIGESQKLGIDTFFIPAKQNKTHIRSSFVKALQREQGMVHDFVPLYVKQKLEEKISNQYIVGVTGEIAVGKTYICNQFEKLGKKMKIQVYNIELDYLGHRILEKLGDPLYVKVRKKIIDRFGTKVRKKKAEFIDRKKLGKIVFADQKALEDLNSIMHEAILMQVRREIYLKEGLILLNAALFAEADIGHLCNNNILLVTASKEIQKGRLEKRGYTDKQIERRLESQYDQKQKRERILKQIKNNKYGKLWEYNNSEDTIQEEKFQKLFEKIVKYLDIKKQGVF